MWLMWLKECHVYNVYHPPVTINSRWYGAPFPGKWVVYDCFFPQKKTRGESM